MKKSCLLFHNGHGLIMSQRSQSLSHFIERFVQALAQALAHLDCSCSIEPYLIYTWLHLWSECVTGYAEATGAALAPSSHRDLAAARHYTLWKAAAHKRRWPHAFKLGHSMSNSTQFRKSSPDAVQPHCLMLCSLQKIG